MGRSTTAARYILAVLRFVACSEANMTAKLPNYTITGIGSAKPVLQISVPSATNIITKIVVLTENALFCERFKTKTGMVHKPPLFFCFKHKKSSLKNGEL